MTSIALGMPVARPPSEEAGSSGRPADPRLVDRYGRVATDLRVSLTDKCSLRCTYCMPADGLDWLPSSQVLGDEEVIRLVRLAVERLGVTEVRFTGGEPLLRRGLEGIIEATKRLRTDTGAAPLTALTTNGVGLAKRAAGLRAAGLDRVNVSLDTLDAGRFAAITHRDRHADVLAGLAAAAGAGLGPVKVNAVLLPGVNDDEAVPLLRWALRHRYELRFIEQMPLDAQGAWRREAMVTADRILADLTAAFRLTPTDPGRRGAAPAQTWFVDGETSGEPGGISTDRTDSVSPADQPRCESTETFRPGHRTRVGVIASVTRPFCGDCARTRLTADGQIRDCLFARGETDLRGLLRAGRTDDDLAQVWRTAMWAKRPGHGIDDPAFLQPDRPMSAIGG